MRTICVSVLLVAALCCASAARVEPDALLSSTWPTANAANVQTWFVSNRGKEDKTAYVAFYFEVDPQDRKTFIDCWLELERATMAEKGVMFYDLKHPETNNVMFVGYGEWKSMRHFMDHYESDHFTTFMADLAKHDIEVTLVPLERPDVAELNPPKEMMHKNHLAHVVTHYHVPPHAHKEFLDAWDTTEKAVEGEKGAHVYSLRKVFNDNTRYYGYGTWERHEDYHAHYDSDHVRELRRTLNKHGIVWHMMPLFKVGHQPE